MNYLDKAIELAIKGHTGQQDKAGQPYILHPLRLMFRFDTETEMIVAVLHDVIEDTALSLESLKGYGFSDEVIDAVDCLSKKNDESYDAFILRVSSNKLAIKIKIEDIKDNLNLSRLKNISAEDLLRIEKYHNALNVLKNK
jgi:(p)ppGpp synthase/HD superfamily hydrolase